MKAVMLSNQLTPSSTSPLVNTPPSAKRLSKIDSLKALEQVEREALESNGNSTQQKIATAFSTLTTKSFKNLINRMNESSRKSAGKSSADPSLSPQATARQPVKFAEKTRTPAKTTCVEFEASFKNSKVSSSSDNSAIPEISSQTLFLDENLPNNVSCECENHPGKDLLNRNFNLTVDFLHKLLFTQSELMSRQYQFRKLTNLNMSEWKDEMLRIEYSMNAGAFGTARIAEVLRVLKQKKKQVIVIESETITQGVPYCDYFTVITRFCVTRVDATTSHLLVKFLINYKKQPNFISKSKTITSLFIFFIQLFNEGCHYMYRF